MKKLLVIAFVTLLLTGVFATPAVASDNIPAAGGFDVTIDFSSLTLTPVGANCLLVVNGEVLFTGTLDGTATATTTALVQASCADVATTPPGTFQDEFKSDLEFTGTIDGTPISTGMTYQGVTQVGGNINGKFLLDDGAKGNLDVDAIVAQGGTYDGFVLLP